MSTTAVPYRKQQFEAAADKPRFVSSCFKLLLAMGCTARAIELHVVQNKICKIFAAEIRIKRCSFQRISIP